MDDVLSAITNLVLLYIKRVSDLVQLAALEAQLAFRTFVIIVILLFLTASLVTVCWASLLVCLFFYLVSLEFTYLSASTIVFCVNVIALIGIGLFIYKIKNNLFFPATTKQLAHKNLTELDVKHEQVET